MNAGHAKAGRLEGHSNNWVGIYVDELAKDTNLRAGAPYPECTRIVKPILQRRRGEVGLQIVIRWA